MIAFTPSALAKIKEVLTGIPLRIYVQGGGCGGFQYGFSEARIFEDDDFVFGSPVPYVIDSLSAQYLQGATVDYKEENLSAHFTVILNPNSNGSCGCGSSFNPKSQ